jgi:hypothetical protein
MVLLDKLRERAPVSETDVFSSGGELKGSRNGLPLVLAKYGLPGKFLKEATTRQVHQDARKLIERLDYGRKLDRHQPTRDQQLQRGIELLVAKARDWLARQPLKVNCDRQSSPSAWVAEILSKARGRSGGKVEQHLVGAKLKTRHPNVEIPNFPGHAADMQTKRSGDFPLERVSYHVTATDGKEAISRCKENVETGVHPVLLVPRQHLARASWRAENEGIADRISVLAIEDFITQNIIEMSTETGEDFFTTLRAIVSEYNRRLEEVETDLSLKIEVQ